MPGAVFLEGDSVELRTIEEEDLEFLRDHINSPGIRNNLDLEGPANLEQEKKFFEEVISAEEPVNLLITQDSEPLGTLELREKKASDTGEIGIWLKEDAHGQGYGTEAVSLIIDHAFDQIGLHKVFARAYAENTGSRKLWEKLGFTEEGVLREDLYRNGAYEDCYQYGLLEEEWER